MRCEHEGGEAFLDVDGEFGDTDTEDYFGFTLEGFREVASDFGVSEGDVGLVEVEPAREVLH